MQLARVYVLFQLELLALQEFVMMSVNSHLPSVHQSISDASIHLLAICLNCLYIMVYASICCASRPDGVDDKDEQHGRKARRSLVRQAR